MFTRLVWSVVILIGLIVLMVGTESPLLEIQNTSVSKLYLQKIASGTDIVIMQLGIESVTTHRITSSCVRSNQCANADIKVTVSNQNIVSNYCYSYSHNCGDNPRVKVNLENDMNITLSRSYQPGKAKYQYKVDASCQLTTHLKYCPQESRTWDKDRVSPTEKLVETYQCIPDSSPAEVKLTIKPSQTNFMMADVNSTHCFRVSKECLNTRSQSCNNRVRMNYDRICPNNNCLFSNHFVTPPNETLQIGFQYQQFDVGDTLAVQLSCSDRYKLNITHHDAQQMIYEEPIIFKIFSSWTTSESRWKHYYFVYNESYYSLHYEMISSSEESLFQISCIPSVESTSTEPQTSPVSATTDATTLSPDTVELTLVVDRINETKKYQSSLNFQSVGVPNVTHLTNTIEGFSCSDYINMNPCPVNATNIRYRIQRQKTTSLRCLTGIQCNNSVSLSDTMYLSISRGTPATTNITIRCKSSYKIQINESNYERNVKLMMERNYNNNPPSSFKTTVTEDGANNVTSYWNSAQQHRIRCVPDDTQPGTTSMGTEFPEITSVTSTTASSSSRISTKKSSDKPNTDHVEKQTRSTTVGFNNTGSGTGGQTDSDRIGLIVGLTVSFLVLAVIITLIVIFIRKRRQRKESPQIQESVYYGNSPVNDTAEEGDYNVLHQRIPQNTEQIYADQEDNYQYSGIPDLQTVRYSPRREDRNSYHLVEFSSPTDNKNPRIHALNDNYDNTDDSLLKSGEPGITSAVVGLAGDVYSEVTKPSGGQEEQEIEMIENDIYEHAQTSDEEDCNYSLAHDI